MDAGTKRKTSLTLAAAALDEARALGINVSAVAEEALRHAAADARRHRWLEDNTESFAAQAEWHAQNDHPLSDIMAGPGVATWRS